MSALRDVAQAQLNGHPVVVEQLPLVEDLVGYLLGAAEEERPGAGGLRLVGGQRHRDALAALVVVGHPAGLEVRMGDLDGLAVGGREEAR